MRLCYHKKFNLQTSWTFIYIENFRINQIKLVNLITTQYDAESDGYHLILPFSSTLIIRDKLRKHTSQFVPRCRV